MRSIKFKLILSTSIMLLASLSFVSSIVISSQIKSQRSDMEDSAGYLMEIVNAKVTQFFEKPCAIVVAAESYIKTHDNLDKETLKNWMGETVKSSDSAASLLYYTSEVPYKNGLYITHIDKHRILNSNFFNEQNFEKYEKLVNTPDGYINLEAGNGNYLIGCALPEQTGWLFVNTGLDSDLFDAIQKNLLFSILISVGCILVALVITVLIARTLVKPINTVDVAVNGIAEGNAKLTQRLTATSKDEVGHLVNGFNKFMEKLHGIVSDVKFSKDNLGVVKVDL